MPTARGGGWITRWPTLFDELGVDGAALVAETQRRESTARQAARALFDRWATTFARLRV